MADIRVILAGDSILDNRYYAVNPTPRILEKGAPGRFINLSVHSTQTMDFDKATRVVPEFFYKAAENTDTPYADKTVELFPEVRGVKYVILSVGGNEMLEMLQMLRDMNPNKSATTEREFEIQWEADVVKELSKRIIKVLDKYKTTYPDATITYVKPYYMTEAMHKDLVYRLQTGVTFEVFNRVLDEVIHKIRNKYYILEFNWGDEDVAIGKFHYAEPTTKGALLLAEKIEEWVNEEGEKQDGIEGKAKGKEEEEEEEGGIVEAKNGKGVLDPMPAEQAPVAEEQDGIEGKGKGKEEEEDESAPRSQKQGTLPLCGLTCPSWLGITDADVEKATTTKVKVRLGDILKEGERLEDGILISEQPFNIFTGRSFDGKVLVELSKQFMLVRKEDVYITNEEEEGGEGEEVMLTRAEELRNEDIYRPRPLTKNKFLGLAGINEINLLQIYRTSLRKKRSDDLFNDLYTPSDHMHKFKEVNRIGKDMPIPFEHYNILTFTLEYTKFDDTYPTGSTVTTLDDIVDEFPLPNERVERLKVVAQGAAEQMANENKIIVCVCRGGANRSRLLAQMILCYLRIRWYRFYRIAINSRLLPDDKQKMLPQENRLMQYVNEIEAEEEALIEKARSSNDEEEGDEEEEKARVGKRPSLRSVPRLSRDLLVPEVPERWNTPQCGIVRSFNVVLNESPPDVSDLRVGDVVEVVYKRHNEERLYYIVAIDNEMLLVLQLKDEGNNTLKHVGENLCSINRHLLNRVMVRVDSEEEEEEESVEGASSHWRTCQRHEHCHKANGHRGRCKIQPPEAPNHEEESSKKKGKRRKLHM